MRIYTFVFATYVLTSRCTLSSMRAAETVYSRHCVTGRVFLWDKHEKKARKIKILASAKRNARLFGHLSDIFPLEKGHWLCSDRGIVRYERHTALAQGKKDGISSSGEVTRVILMSLPDVSSVVR